MDQPARDSIRAAAWTALWTFVATFSLAALDWLQAVAEWASDAPDAAAFPSVAVLGKALVSAAVAAVAFALNAAYRLAQARGVGLPGQVPSYSAQVDRTRLDGDAGQVNDAALRAVLFVLVVMLIVILIT